MENANIYLESGPENSKRIVSRGSPRAALTGRRKRGRAACAHGSLPAVELLLAEVRKPPSGL
jgi:hypothetical protein